MIASAPMRACIIATTSCIYMLSVGREVVSSQTAPFSFHYTERSRRGRFHDNHSSANKQSCSSVPSVSCTARGEELALWTGQDTFRRANSMAGEWAGGAGRWLPAVPSATPVIEPSDELRAHTGGAAELPESSPHHVDGCR